MSNPGKGPADYLALGDWNASCFRCGSKRKASELRKQWQGYWVCPEHWEPRHPQDFVKAVPDETAIPWSQPNSDLYVGPNICTPTGSSAYPGYAMPGCLRPGNNNLQWTPPVSPVIPNAGDPYFTNVVLLLHCDGTDGGVTFTDSSLQARTPSLITSSTTSATQFKFGSASAKLTVNTGKLLYPASADFTLTGTFTVEFWIFITSNPPVNQYFMADDLTATGGFKLDTTGKLSFSMSSTILFGTPTQNAWHHVALCKSGSSWLAYFDGSLVASGFSLLYAAAAPNLGVLHCATSSGSDTNGLVNAYLDDIRFTQGVARYLTNFAVPTAAFPNFPS